MAQSGAILREVGTTNRTRLRDYENAINENTRVLLRVHPSNFKITGFAEKPSLAELAALSERSFRAASGGPRLRLSRRSVRQRFRGAHRAPQHRGRRFPGDVQWR